MALHVWFILHFVFVTYRYRKREKYHDHDENEVVDEHSKLQ